jgi:hypothetical protein
VRAYAEEVATWPAREAESFRALEATAEGAEVAARVYAYQMGVDYEEEEEDVLAGDEGWDLDEELPF